MSDDTDLVYWMGRSINAMTREELQVALGEAIMQIEHLKNKNHYWMMAYMKEKQKEINAQHSRFTNPDYLASFC